MIGATALPTGSPYFDILIVGGLAAIAIGLGGLLWMWIFPPKPKPQRPAMPPGRFETASPLEPPVFAPRVGSFIGIEGHSEGGTFKNVVMHNLNVGIRLSGSRNKFDNLRITADRPFVIDPNPPVKPDEPKEDGD